MIGILIVIIGVQTSSRRGHNDWFLSQKFDMGDFRWSNHRRIRSIIDRTVRVIGRGRIQVSSRVRDDRLGREFSEDQEERRKIVDPTRTGRLSGFCSARAATFVET